MVHITSGLMAADTYVAIWDNRTTKDEVFWNTTKSTRNILTALSCSDIHEPEEEEEDYYYDDEEDFQEEDTQEPF